uniref:Uncharacterized protein n=1 Tax=Gracilaria firma TaxID=2510791 RepID=A0A1P8D6K5_9FLOR|nr:hypothetical protein [Gracilaria firma]APR74438.1 hypothetical protein [Gracilaria firma]
MLILKFSPSDEQIDNLASILNWFFYRYRYRDKFIKHYSYVTKTIRKVVSFSITSNLLGSCLDNELLNKNVNSSGIIQSKFYKSVDKEDVIKICNLFNFFYMDLKSSNSNNKVFDNTHNSNNYIRIISQGDKLNHFDLTILMGILHQYKTCSIYDSFKLDVASILGLIGYDTGYSHRKLISSLTRLSSTTIECRKQYLKLDAGSSVSTDDCFYTFCGNFLSFEALSNKKLTSGNVQLSLPLIKMFGANNHYALLNWQVFTSLPTTKLRLLYFYFCLNFKVSNYFTEFSIKSLNDNLYCTSSSVSNTSFFSQEFRKMLLFFIKHQNIFIDFQINLIINSSYNTIFSIKVRRSRLTLTSDR